MKLRFKLKSNRWGARFLGGRLSVARWEIAVSNDGEERECSAVAVPVPVGG
jgi:hypothetical protein